MITVFTLIAYLTVAYEEIRTKLTGKRREGVVSWGNPQIKEQSKKLFPYGYMDNSIK